MKPILLDTQLDVAHMHVILYANMLMLGRAAATLSGVVAVVFLLIIIVLFLDRIIRLNLAAQLRHPL